MKKIRTPKNNRIHSDTSIGTKIFKYVSLAVLIAYSLSIILSFLFAFMISIKSEDSYMYRLLGLPIGKDLRLNNYFDVLTVLKVKIDTAEGTKYAGIIDMLMNSLVFSVGGAFFASLSCCVTAYAVARFKNWMSSMIYGIVIVCMALPIVGSLPSELQILMNLNLYNRRIGLVFLASSFLGMHFLILHAAFKAIPKDFAEAAKIDGAGEWRIFLTIMFPLVKLAFFTIFLLKFMVLWNNYETPLIHTPNYPVLSYGVFKIYKDEILSSEPDVRTMPHKIAAGMMVLLPILVLFLFTHKRLIGNVSMGGVKG